MHARTIGRTVCGDRKRYPETIWVNVVYVFSIPSKWQQTVVRPSPFPRCTIPLLFSSSPVIVSQYENL